MQEMEEVQTFITLPSFLKKDLPKARMRGELRSSHRKKEVYQDGLRLYNTS